MSTIRSTMYTAHAIFKVNHASAPQLSIRHWHHNIVDGYDQNFPIRHAHTAAINQVVKF
jgi:hypothetical protein